MIVIIPLVIIVGFLAWMLRPGLKPLRPQRNALLVAVILSLAVAVAAVIFQLIHNTSGTIEVAEISNALFLVSLGLILAGIMASIGFIIAQRKDIAKGLGFGVCLSVFISVVELTLLEYFGGV
jgi:hypothetical protein